jgi:hypothetical protein
LKKEENNFKNKISKYKGTVPIVAIFGAPNKFKLEFIKTVTGQTDIQNFNKLIYPFNLTRNGNKIPVIFIVLDDFYPCFTESLLPYSIRTLQQMNEADIIIQFYDGFYEENMLNRINQMLKIEEDRLIGVDSIQYYSSGVSCMETTIGFLHQGLFDEILKII